jgi:hypothetical protein
VFVGGLPLFIWVFEAFLCLLAFLCFCGLAGLFLCILPVYLGRFTLFFNKILLIKKKKNFSQLNVLRIKLYISYKRKSCFITSHNGFGTKKKSNFNKLTQCIIGLYMRADINRNYSLFAYADSGFMVCKCC